MNLHNIISAGQMMSIVAALLGAFDCGATFALNEGIASWEIVFGAAFVVCGLALMVMFGRVARRHADTASAEGDCKTSGAKRPTPSGTPVLIAGTLTGLLGAGGVAADWSAPFSWMMAIVGLALFIDALCLHIGLSQMRN